ncbi:hypothetical protein TVH25_18335 [Rhodococcus sp. 7Tela_A2]|uniref:hypothetical protein n=1 Tax=Rhodococcus sp. 7Tela_A2 TaxID=3093744 RepID=UPI003BB7A6D2
MTVGGGGDAAQPAPRSQSEPSQNTPPAPGAITTVPGFELPSGVVEFLRDLIGNPS